MNKELHLDTLNFYEHLNEQERHTLTNNAKTLTIMSNNELNSDVFCNNSLIIVNAGIINIYLNLASGRHLQIFQISNNEYYYYTPHLFKKAEHFNISLHIDKPINITYINQQFVQELMKTNKMVEASIFKSIAEKLIFAVIQFEDKMSTPLATRIMNCLNEHSKIQASKTVQISHEKIAIQLGSSREVVSKVLKKLANNNQISLSKGSITIL